MSQPPGADNYPREIPLPEGCPDGWYQMEHMYKSGNYMGKCYYRFSHRKIKDPKHKGLLSVKAVIERDAVDNNKNPKEELEAYEEMKRRRSEVRAIETARLREERVEQRDQAVEVFRSMYGPLDGPTVKNFKGWRTEHEYLASCDQSHVTYYDLNGKSWKLLKDLEAYFGCLILRGGDNAELQSLRSTEEKEKKRQKPSPSEQEVKAEPVAVDTDTEVEQMEVTSLEHRGDGYYLNRRRVVEEWVVLPNDLLSINLDVICTRLADAGWVRSSSTGRRRTFKCGDGLPGVILYPCGKMLVKSTIKRYVHNVATFYIAKGLNKDDMDVE
eukprot:NODE_11379_length_1290_cov_8.764402.p1 GENE.NODE_11379_length_1290_cov_8.764402~~NODE_11379_length_1290_cov_8.764402.p1  ORF type:complete len:327 (+),score=78.33 NODE_11379_length_1290_cov_8.764402:70-1050(+)